MILASTLAVRGRRISPFLKGPAKVYDGAFDYDTFQKGTTFSEKESNTSFLFSFQYNEYGTLFNVGKFGGGESQRFEGEGAIFNSDGFRFFLQKAQSTDWLNVIFSVSLEQGKRYTLILKKQRTFFSAFLYNIEDNSYTALNIIFYENTLTDGSIAPDPSTCVIGKRNLGSPSDLFFNGALKQFEIVNTVSFDEEAAARQGSFRAAGIARNSGEYLFALNTDQTDGNPPTTFPNTPQYTITSFGGAEYVDYENL